jgi:proline dehydrogenase
MATMDILGEFITTPEEAVANARAYEELIRRISDANLPDTNASIKLTFIGLKLDPDLCLRNLRGIMKVVEETDNFLRIDMEDSSCTDGTLEMFLAMKKEFPGRVGIVLQSMLRRTADDTEKLCSESVNIRLCKGIYLEPRDIAWTDREINRRSYVTLLDRMFELGAYVGIATHDEILVFEAFELIRKHRLQPNQYEFQMLQGVQEDLRKIIIDAGHRLRVYVPFGEQWYPYSVRRLRENPEIAGHALKQIFSRG